MTGEDLVAVDCVIEQVAAELKIAPGTARALVLQWANLEERPPDRSGDNAGVQRIRHRKGTGMSAAEELAIAAFLAALSSVIVLLVAPVALVFWVAELIVTVPAVCAVQAAKWLRRRRTA